MNTIKDAKAALAGHTLSTEAVNVLDEAARLLREEPMKIPTDKSRPSDISYCCAYVDFITNDREESTRPLAVDFGLTEALAEVLRSQCRIELHMAAKAARPAVTFTESEARQAATDLRDIANTLCEIPLPEDEKTLRLLAQKFDTWRKE